MKKMRKSHHYFGRTKIGLVQPSWWKHTQRSITQSDFDKTTNNQVDKPSKCHKEQGYNILLRPNIHEKIGRTMFRPTPTPKKAKVQTEPTRLDTANTFSCQTNAIGQLSTSNAIFLIYTSHQTDQNSARN